jgi:hypothetical protein
MVQVNFQATDFPTASYYSPPSSSSPSRTTTIALAVTLPVVALIFAGCAWFWYRRRAAARKAVSPAYQAAQSTEPSEMDQANSLPPDLYYRASGVPTEVSGEPARYEVVGSTPRYEMVGSEASEVVHEMYAGGVQAYRDDVSKP